MTKTEIFIALAIILIGVILAILHCPGIIMFIIGIILGYSYPNIGTWIKKFKTT